MTRSVAYYPELIEGIFEQADEEALNSDQFDFFQTTEKGHGREETRSHYTTSASSLSMVSQWSGLKTVGIVVSERSTKKKEKSGMSVLYFQLTQ